MTLGGEIHTKGSLSDLVKVQSENGPYILLLTICSAFGGFLFGYDTGVVSGALILMERRSQLNLSSFQSETVVSATIAGAVAGAMFGGQANVQLGRRGVILMSSAIFTIGALMMAYAYSFGFLVLGRIVVGLGVGFSSMTVPMYIAEVSPPSLRGALVSCNTLFITAGQFSASIIDGLFSRNESGWRWMLGIGAIPSAIQFLAFLFLPESPNWLLINDKEDEAKKVLQKIRSSDNVEEEFNSIKMEALKQKNEKSDLDLSVKSVRQALLVGCILQATQQLCGINTVMYYSATILQMAGFTDDSTAIWMSAGVAFSNFVFTFVGISLVDSMGRRKLTLYSLAGVSIALFMLGLSFMIAEQNSEPSKDVGICYGLNTCFSCVSNPRCGYCGTIGACIEGNNTMSFNEKCEDWNFQTCPNASKVEGWFIFISLFLYLACFAPGMGPMPWTINAEIYPLKSRSMAVSIATSVNWICNLVVAFTFLSISREISAGWTFILYCAFSIIGLVFFIVYLPETKGVPLEQIQKKFESNFSLRLRKTYSPIEEVSQKELDENILE